MKRLLVFVIVCMCSVANAVSPTAQVSVAPTTVDYGDTFEVALTVDLPAGYRIDPERAGERLTHVPGSDIPSFTIKDIITDAGVIDAKETTTTYRYVLDPWRGGEQVLSFGTLVVDGGEGLETLYLVPPVVTMTVLEPPANGEGLYNPGLLPLPGSPLIGINQETWQRLSDSTDYSKNQAERHLNTFKKRSFPWLPVALLLAIVVVVWAFREHMAGLIAALRHDGGVATNPRVAALSALSTLEQQQMPSNGMYERYYVTLTMIVRKYIEDVFGVKAPEHTTEEFLREVIEERSFDENTRELLESFLCSADLVKFARDDPTVDECSEAMATAKRFVGGS